MAKTIFIVIICLAIVITIIFSIGQNSTDKSTIIDCDTLCKQMGSKGWSFPGVRPIGTFFYSKEECIPACQNRFKK